jgi:hypothetical protein
MSPIPARRHSEFPPKRAIEFRFRLIANPYGDLRYPARYGVKRSRLPHNCIPGRLKQPNLMSDNGEI